MEIFKANAFSRGLELNEDEWEAITYSINKGECVLLLGPGCARNQDGSCLYDEFCSKIGWQIGMQVLKGNDRLFSLYEEFKSVKPRIYRSGTEKILNEVYNHVKPHSSYYTIAQIPFRVVISTSPDKLLPDIFDENGWQYQFKTYDRKERIIISEEPTSDNPLILNLFGSYEERESLILSHDDIFEFLFSIIPDKALPEILGNEISSSNTSFIFLGFDFESWYLKLILRLLHLHTKEKDSALAYPWQNEILQHETKVFYSNKFNLKFVESDIDVFLNELAKRIEKPRSFTAKSGVSKIEVATMQVTNKVRRCIQNNDLNDAIIFLTEYSNQYNSSLRSTIDVISGNLTHLATQKKTQVLYPEHERVEFAKIRTSLAEIVEEIESNIKIHGAA